MVPGKASLGCGYTKEVNTGPLKKEVPYTSRAMCVGFGIVVAKYLLFFSTRSSFVKSFYAPAVSIGFFDVIRIQIYFTRKIIVD